jgi:urease accessory protein
MVKRSWTGVLLLADGRFPDGGHAYSGGLEAAVTAGTVRDMRSLELFLRGRLRTTGLVAAGIAATAGELAAAAGELAAAAGEFARAENRTGRGAGYGVEGTVRRAGSWAALDAETDARTPSPAQREASRRQGRALLRAARAAWPDAQYLVEIANAAARNAADGPLRNAANMANPPLRNTADTPLRNAANMADPPPRNTADTVGTPPRKAMSAPAREPVNTARRGAANAPHHPIVLGAAVVAGGGDPADAAAVAAYQSVTGPASAAVRLLSLDPMEVSGLLARLADDIDDVAELAARSCLDELPFPSAPALDLLAETHARVEVRLFAS